MKPFYMNFACVLCCCPAQFSARGNIDICATMYIKMEYRTVRFHNAQESLINPINYNCYLYYWISYSVLLFWLLIVLLLFQQTNGWPMQLLSVACLSLAAKMEEPLVPSLLDLQVHIYTSVSSYYFVQLCEHSTNVKCIIGGSCQTHFWT